MCLVGAVDGWRGVWVASAAALVLLPVTLRAQNALFDFDAGPLHAPTPLMQVAGGLTAEFTATGSGYSIQQADVLGFTPAGFSGNCLYPNSVFPSDLSIAVDHPLTGISLLFAPEEYATDSSATIRVTAYLGTDPVGSSTASADPPGTWPTGTLVFASAHAFDNVVVHYDAAPPTGGDWGPVFMVDEVSVTPVPEPTRAAETALALLCLGLVRRRRRR